MTLTCSLRIDSFSFSFSSRLGNLYWHKGLIPEDEIWVKLGADKGGKPVSTMKFNFQIVNIHQPNSVNNTINFSLFEANDNITNFTLAMERLRDQIDEVKAMTWR